MAGISATRERMRPDLTATMILGALESRVKVDFLGLLETAGKF